MKEDHAQHVLDHLYEQARFELNPDDEECWNCGGEGYTFDCIDGCCSSAEWGCDLCSSDCAECRRLNRAITRAVRVQVLSLLNIPVARLFLRGEGRNAETLPDDKILLNLHAARVAHEEFTPEQRMESSLWVEGLL